MIHVTSTIALDEDEIEETFIRSSGPGGQHVNRTDSAVQLRFDAARSPSLSEAVRARLTRLAGRRMPSEGVIVLEAPRFRAPARHPQESLNRRVVMIPHAAGTPTPPPATPPPPRP